ncbi:MAG: GDSL-type esterase/lipase family protein [Planctomycetota bacterium]
MNQLLLSALAFFLATSLLSAGEDPVVPPPKDQDPTVAERGYFDKYPRAWNDFHKMFLERGKQGPVELLFIGDSILQAWGDSAQKDLWKTNFDSYKAANFSIGGDRTQQVLWRIANGELDGITPKLVVLQIGCNNLWTNDSPDKIYDGIKKIIESIRKKLPASKVLVLGILPAQKSASDPVRDKIRSINSASAKFNDGSSVRFVDIGAKFTDASGNIDLDKDLYQPDCVHLKTKGYETWAAAVKPVIVEMMK